MGWASGSSLMRVIIEAVKLEVPDAATRQRIYEPIIRVFDDADWDTHSEVLGIDDAFDAAMKDVHPPDPWEAGYDAAVNGEPYEACPYAEKSTEWAQWHHGYTSALE